MKDNLEDFELQKEQDNLETLSEENEGTQEKEAVKRKPISVLLEILIYIGIIYACVYFIPTYVIQRTIVDGPSMLDTLHNNDSLLVDKCYYKLSGLDRFDIVVFYPHGRESKEYYVKRLIGLPGETVQIKGKDIYINGKIITENYGKDPITYSGLAEDPITLGDNQYFVLGDNREVSLDSRYEDVGLVQKKNIGGRAIVRIWPLDRFGLID